LNGNKVLKRLGVFRVSSLGSTYISDLNLQWLTNKKYDSNDNLIDYDISYISLTEYIKQILVRNVKSESLKSTIIEK
jgi:hypothetical protein